MRDKIEKLCNKFIKEQQGKFINSNLREDLKNNLKHELNDCEIICDVKNNSDDIVKRNCIIITFIYNENDESKKLNVILGSEEDVNELKNMNLCFDTSITWKTLIKNY